MLDLNKIQHIAKSYSPQELFAALVWQRQFNNFDGEQVITDLSNNPDLWHSFLFAKAIYTKYLSDNKISIWLDEIVPFAMKRVFV